ncbi:HPr family phosphocarrier protein [Desulfococcaceae bacterium OttesenSCG-928-F15]|nr:HPr family phosphocarrier protein [Desulfococcaceae bacterium OttesenSCG-928-F15]
MEKREKEGGFTEKIQIYSEECLRYCMYISALPQEKYGGFTKLVYGNLTASSRSLEDFLDFHGAKNNRDWCLYRELGATIRHISMAAYAQQHILDRLASYGVSTDENFHAECMKTLEFLDSVLVRAALLLIEEAKRLGVAPPRTPVGVDEVTSIQTSEMLEHNIDDEDEIPYQNRYIVKISSEFLEIARDFEHYAFYEPCSYEEILDLVPGKVNEAEMQRFEVLIHNLQSSFDSYVIYGGYRLSKTRLKRMRSHFSVCFHLLQIINRLLHYYERHIRDRGFKDTYKKIQEILCVKVVNPEELLDRIVNFALFHVNYFLVSGTRIAKNLLNEYVEQGTISVGIPMKLGFHSRPSLMVAKVVQHYGGPVELLVGDACFDASSVLDIQWAGGKIQKEGIEKVSFRGDLRALKDIEILAGVNYGEDSMGKGIPLPKELSYLYR